MNSQEYINQLFSLEGHVGIVTGASRGLGMGTAQVLTRAGATVYNLDMAERSQEKPVEGNMTDILAKTVDYRCNEFLDDADRQLFVNMARQNPRRYRVAGLGEWGVAEGLIFENWREVDFDLSALRAQPQMCSIFGLDFGYVNDETALFCGLVDLAARRIFVFDEIYQRGLSNEQIYAEIGRRGYAKERICADSAEPKSIDRLRELGIERIKPARKGPDSVRHGIDFLQDFEILVAPRCRNFLAEISAYNWQADKNGRLLNVPADCNNHLMDAMRYAAEDLLLRDSFSFS